MKKKITEQKFIKKITSIIDTSNSNVELNLKYNDGVNTVLRDKLYYELKGIDEDGNEHNGYESEVINIPFTDIKTRDEDRKKLYLHILKERFGVDGKIPNKAKNPDAWNFFISNIDIFDPMLLTEGEQIIS